MEPVIEEIVGPGTAPGPERPVAFQVQHGLPQGPVFVFLRLSQDNSFGSLEADTHLNLLIYGFQQIGFRHHQAEGMPVIDDPAN